MKRPSVLLLLIVLTTLGAQVACSPNLPDSEKSQWSNQGRLDGSLLGKLASSESWLVSWVTPNMVQEFQRDSYIPKGYRDLEDFADACLPNGTPYKREQMEEACRAYNWGFYFGFYSGYHFPELLVGSHVH